ncbi:MAG TPA: hypothetical protein VEJ84_11425 [Acidimicrobiales bacterium]|nr:hypothetical protein [Acidimicrobiales bacterium]
MLRRSPTWRKELQRNVVRITERERRAIGGIDDTPIFDAEVIQPRLPPFQLGPVGAGEGEVIEAEPPLVKGFSPVEIRELMDAYQGLASEKPYDVMEGTSVFVDYRLAPEQPLVPGSADGEIGDSEGHMGNSWEICHDFLFLRGRIPP